MGDLTILIKFHSPDLQNSVLIDDDGRVAYAYLFDSSESICSDVWLYNRCPTPIEPEWKNIENAPFANPASYVKEVPSFKLPATESDFSIDWIQDKSARTVNILLRGEVIGILTEGIKPGWALLAKKNGPVAKVLGAK